MAMDLSQLVNAFVSQSQDPGLTAQPSWQSELRNQLDPEAAKKRNISNALGAAAAAISASRGGGALRGLSQGIVAGANSYNQGQQANLDKRIENMKALDDSELKRRLTGLEMLKDAVGIQGGQEDRADTKQYRKDSLDLQREQVAARNAEAAARQGGAGTSSGILEDGAKGDRELPATGGNVGGNASTPPKPKSGSDGLDIEKRRALVAARKEFTDWVENNNPSEDEKQKYWDGLLDVYQIRDLYEPKKQASQANQTQGQQQFQEGQTATNPKTGQKVIFKNGMWQPL